MSWKLKKRKRGEIKIKDRKECFKEDTCERWSEE
jgi:hypothetical protein